jgi:hypothetical protein
MLKPLRPRKGERPEKNSQTMDFNVKWGWQNKGMFVFEGRTEGHATADRQPPNLGG